ncbi:MAG: hypothetical protein ACI9MR_002953 [Myxococcota bacterium]|jgi:hypothetical protein
MHGISTNVILLVLLWAVPGSGCGKSLPAGTLTAEVATQRARAALRPFKSSLQGALKAGLAEGGPAAIEACRDQAPRLAAGAANAGVIVGRTSANLRNPHNAPRAWMKPLLAEFASAERPGAYRAVALGDGRWGYAEAIHTKGLCLSCHGSALGGEVSSALAKLYPRDRARGYAPGDFRGIFWAEVSPGPVSARPAKISQVTPVPADTSVAATPPPDTTVPTVAKPDTAVAPPPTSDTAAPGQVVAPVDAGVIHAKRFAELQTLAPEDFEVEPAALSLLEVCGPSVEKSAESCELALWPSVVGLRFDGAVALLTAESEGGCGDWGPMVSGVIAKLPALRAGVTKPFPDPQADEEAAAKAAWTWLGRLPHANFVPAVDLIRASISQPSGIRSHVPLVVLGAPLQGWLIDAVAGPKAATYRLVTPDRNTAHRLGTISNTSGGCSAEELEYGPCTDFTAPNVEQVVLTLDHKSLIVTTGMGDGGHCGSNMLKIVAWPLPKGVLLPAGAP